MRTWLTVALLIAAATLCLSAANYYARVPKDGKVFADLRLLEDEGFLGGWSEPGYSMLRLEVAMLLQGGLPEFFRAQEGGTTTDAADAAAQRLVKEFKEELTGIGAQLPGIDAPKPDQAEQQGGNNDVPALDNTSFKAERLETGQMVIEEEVLSDGGSEARPHPSSEQAQAQASSTISLDSLAAEQKNAPPAFQPVELPAGDDWRSSGHDPAEFVAAESADEAKTDAPAMSLIEIDAARETELTASDFQQPFRVRDEPVAAPSTPAPPVQPTPRAELELPHSEPVAAAANSADADAQPAVEAMVPRPNRGQSGGGATGRDMNLLLEDRATQQSGTAAFHDNASPGRVGYEVRDERLGPPRPYRRNIAVDVQPFLDAQGQLMFRDSDGTVLSGTTTDLRLYWVDAGLDFEHEDWAARVAVNFNDRSSEPKLHELWAEFRDSENGLYGRAGRSTLPFAERKGWFPTFSYARELGFTSANTIGLGWNKPDWGGSVWVYDAPVESVGGGSSSLDELAFNLSMMSAPDDYSDTSWRLAFAYMSELGGHERRLAAGSLAASVSGFNLSGGYTWDGGVWQIALDYTAALDSYSAGALDANGNGTGDKPSALALELVYSPEGLAFWGLRAERTTQYAGAAGSRWGLLYGQWLSEEMLARLELSRGTYNAFSPGRSRDIALTADLNLVF